jgi:eukaryotic-like serine/threonine-protein kinase
MTIDFGARLGPYEIISPLGEGGMGEVYLARDTRLDRLVAVKVLPSHLSHDPDSKQRFEREARAISHLTHPHICALFDVGSQDGHEYLVMELLDGQTLADRLDKGALTFDNVLRFGSQIAHALGHAHRAGIVHRDLKPGNVMLTRSGVKLLDFGLAKPLAAAGALTTTVNGSVAPTLGLHPNLTERGTIVGTFQYMAPEQLEGKDADWRTDIFALGCVLYEMATGRKAFDAQSRANLIAAILEKDPPPISSFQPMMPPALDRIVRTCLAKDPDDRWESAHDVASQLEWLGEAGSQAGLPAAVVSRRRRRERLAWAGAGAAGLIALVLAARRLPARSRTEPVLKASINAPERSAFALFGDPSGPAVLSPDGQLLAFVASTDGKIRLWSRRLDAVEATPLPGTENAAYPFWSPDSRSIAFFADGKLKRLAAAGGVPPQIVADAPTGRGGAWNRAGIIVFAPEANGVLDRVSASGGTPVPVTMLDSSRGMATHRWPSFLSDGTHFLYYAATVRLQGKTETDGIYAGSLDSPQSVLVMRSDSAGVVVPPGYLITVSGATLRAVPFDEKGLRPKGEPVTIAGPVLRDWGRFLGAFSASSTGLLVYHGGANAGTAELAWFDRAGRRLPGGTEPGFYSEPSLSPDGKRIAVAVLDPATLNFEVALRGADLGPGTRFTFGASSSGFPIWSQDGARVMFSSNRRGLGGLYSKPSGGTQPERLELATDGDAYPLDWSRDERFVVYGLYSKTTRRSELWIEPTFGDRKPYRLFSEGIKDPIARFSPDGKWLAYNSYESGVSQIYVTSFPVSTGKWQVSQMGGFEPRWAHDGRKIYFLSLESTMMEADVKGDSAFETGAVRSLFPVPVGAQTSQWAYDVSSDGSRFLLVVPSSRQSATSSLTLVANWLTEATSSR